MRRMLPSLALFLALSAPAAADVTIVQTTAGKMGPMSVDGESTTYLKGARMRVDSQMGTRQTTTIFDLDKQQVVTIDHGKKEAEIASMADVAKGLAAISAADIKVTITPTGNKKQILGYDTEEHTVTITVPFRLPDAKEDMGMTMTIGGPAWVSKQAPGLDDYAAFYVAAAEKGLFVTDPRAAKASPGQAKGFVEIYRAMAKAGMPLESSWTIKLEGSGPLAGLMGKAAGGRMTSTVTSLKEGAIADSQFEAPAGYKVKQGK